jgi:hypothetical protein
MKHFTCTGKYRKLITSVFVLPLLLNVTPVLSDEDYSSDSGLFGFGAGYFDTKDDFQYLQSYFSYRNHLRDIYWPYEEAESRDLDWGVDAVVRTGSLFKSIDFDAAAFDIFLGKRLSSGSYLEAGIGIHGLRGDGDVDEDGDIIIEDDTIPTYRAKGLFVITETVDIGIESHYDYLYPEGFDPGSLTDALTSHEIVGALSWKPISTLSLQSESAVNLISDSNTRFWTDLAVLYGISPEWPWIWAGFGAYYQWFEFESDDYWSPERYISYGPRLDSSFPITSRLSGWADIEINIITESQLFEGVGGDVSLGLDFAMTEKTHMLLGISRSDSLRFGEHYYENYAFLSLHWPMP